MVKLSLKTAPSTCAPWLHQVASAYFQELAPKEAPLPRSEIDLWYSDPNLFALLLNAHDETVGFVLVERLEGHHELSEFAVLPDWRGTGIGSRAAALCFERFPGPWALGVAKALPGTARFWDRVLPALPGITGLARGPALTPYQCHSYTFTFEGAR